MRYTWQFAVFFILSVVCGLLLWSAYTGIEAKTIAQVNSEQIVHADQAADGFDSFFTTYNSSLSFLAGDDHIITLDPDGREQMRDFFTSHSSEISSVTRVDENGIITYTYPVETSTGADISSQSHVRQMLDTRSVVISDVFTSVQGFRTIAFHMPVFKNGTFRGSIAILIPFDTLAKENLGNIRVLDSGYAWTISRDGFVLYSPYPEQVGKSVFEVYNTSPSVMAMAEEAMKGARGITAYTIGDDPARHLPAQKFQAIYLPVKIGTTSWSVIVSTPENEILATIQGFRNNLIVISALLILSLLFFAYYAARARGIVQEEAIRKKSEDELRANEQRLASIYNTVGDSIFQLTVEPQEQYRFTSVNAAFSRTTGVPADQILGRTVDEIIPGPALSMVKEKYRQAIREKSIVRWEETSDYPTGQLTGEVSVAPIFDQAGTCTHLIGSVHDITERKLAEEKLLEAHRTLEKRVAERTQDLIDANNRLQELDRLKSAFLATMSHELRTPLNSIIGFSGILGQELAGPLNDEQKKQLGMVSDSAEHLLALINDVLDLSKIEAGQLRIENEEFDIRPVLEKAARTVRPMAESKGLMLSIDVAPEAGTVRADRRRVEQVLLNLLSNAIKFTGKGSIGISCLVRGDALEISVRDTGIGIKPGDLETLFRPFTQVDTGLTRQHEGTGLGLSISKRLVTMMGGTIRVESEPGRGSTFSFTLPVERRHP